MLAQGFWKVAKFGNALGQLERGSRIVGNIVQMELARTIFQLVGNPKFLGRFPIRSYRVLVP